MNHIKSVHKNEALFNQKFNFGGNIQSKYCLCFGSNVKKKISDLNKLHQFRDIC